MFMLLASEASAVIAYPGIINATWGGFASNTATFFLTNLNQSQVSYTPTITFGTGTPTLTPTSNATATLTVASTVDFEVTVASSYIPKNIPGTPKILGKKTITTYTVTSQGGCLNFAYDPACGAPCAAAGGSCDGPGCCYQYQQIVTTYENSPPANYQRIPTSGTPAYWVRL